MFGLHINLRLCYRQNKEQWLFCNENGVPALSQVRQRVAFLRGGPSSPTRPCSATQLQNKVRIPAADHPPARETVARRGILPHRGNVLDDVFSIFYLLFHFDMI